MEKQKELNLVLVNKCVRCVQLAELYLDAESIERQLVWTRANEKFVHGDMMTVDELELLKSRKLSLIRTWELKDCACEYQSTFIPPSSNTGVNYSGGY
jgi:hypothetical protein